MKKLTVLVSSIVLGSNLVLAQSTQMASMRISIKQMEVSYQHSIFRDWLWIEAHTGVANQDINNRFDDFLLGSNIGWNVLSNPQNQISAHTGVGLYFPNYDRYSGTVPLTHASVRLLHFLGKTKKHGTQIDLGYQYGKRTYKQVYTSQAATVSTIETFQVSPLHVSIGYGYRF